MEKKFKILKKDRNYKLKLQIVEEANLIIDSVNFAEENINKLITALDYARENFLIQEESKLEKDLEHWINRLSKETKEMDAFLDRYKTIFRAAKEGKIK